MKSRRNKTEEQVDHHRWVISYADFITLLFAFFVVMYAISSVNVSKYKSISDGMKSAFNKKEQNKSSPSSDVIKDGPEDKQTKGKFNDGLDDLSKSLSELEDNDYKIKRQDGWIELEIKAGNLFASGDAELKPGAVIKLMQLAAKIKDLPYPIVVEGYTDDIPIETPQFPSNWELSATRAATVGRILNSYGILTSRISITGYGEQYPVTTNVTEEGRSQNRRVTIIIAKNRNVDRLVNPGFDQAHEVTLHNTDIIEEVKPAVKNQSTGDPKNGTNDGSKVAPVTNSQTTSEKVEPQKTDTDKKGN